MAKVWSLQSNMNRGELDPRLVGRSDLEAYYNGLANASNVLALPIGGVRKRPGTEYLGDIVYAADDTGVRLETFSFSVDVNYLLVFTDLRMQVYKNGVLMTNLNGSGNDYIVTPWDVDEIVEFDYIQSADTIIITHEDYQPRKIVRSSDTTWTLSTITLSNIPQYDFNDSSSPTPSPTTQLITLASSNAGDRFKMSLEGLLTDEIALGAASAGGYAATATAIQDELLALRNTPNSGIAVTGDHTTTSFTVVFSEAAANNWDDMAGAVIYSQSASFTITVATTVPGTTREEDVWSATRGWPRTCTFHEGRLYFGGSKSLPQTIWGSNVNDYFNFRTRKALDDEAVSVSLDTDQINTIQGIFSNRRLQIFTAGGEFYVPTSPITPENISAPRQSQYGSRRVRPVSIDGVTLFAQTTGKALIQYVYLDEFQASQATSASILSSHLINTPVQMAVSRGTSDDDVNYVYIVNSSGTMTVFNTLSSQGVAGFTRWNSAPSVGSLVKSVAVVDNDVYLAVSRIIDGSDVIQIEKENSLLNTDGALYLSGAHSTVSSGLDHLEGESVVVKVDGAVRSNQTVTSGTVTIDPASTSTIEIGLQYTPLIQTMPLNVNLQNGPNAYVKKKIVRVALELYQSNGIIVQGQRVADKTIGVNQFTRPLPYTGSKQIYLSGYDRRAQVQITQDTPFGFTILNIATEIKT